MCCDLCDFYVKCGEVDRGDIMCCEKCEGLRECHGEANAGSRVNDDEYGGYFDDDDELDDDDDFDDDYDFDDDDDDDDDYDDDDYDEGYLN